jgi:rhodanese-related sulfurtransferase
MEPERITPEQAQQKISSGTPIAIVDARSAESWGKATRQIPGSVRLPPDEAERYLSRVPRDATVITYCT